MIVRLLKLAACGTVFGGFIGASLLLRLILFCASSANQKRVTIALTQRGARILLRILGITIHRSGQEQLPGGAPFYYRIGNSINDHRSVNQNTRCTERIFARRGVDVAGQSRILFFRGGRIWRDIAKRNAPIAKAIFYR